MKNLKSTLVSILGVFVLLCIFVFIFALVESSEFDADLKIGILPIIISATIITELMSINQNLKNLK
jgi:hypothetical protein